MNIDKIKDSMVNFTCSKNVKATPMTKAQYNELRGWNGVESDFYENGYLVMYEPDGNSNVEGFEGYISWSPKNPFDLGYTITETYKDRVRFEYIELLKRMEKLIEFIESKTDEGMKLPDMDILHTQLEAMKLYAWALKERLDMFSKEK